jgi:arginine exporter protein ArgO
LLLILIGIRTARAHVASLDPAGRPEVSSARTALTTLTLTLVNPGSLMGFLALFGAMGVVLKLGLAPYRPALAVAGVAIGGLLWWLFVAFTAHHLKSRLTPATLDRINRWAGVLIAALGFALLMQLAA